MIFMDKKLEKKWEEFKIVKAAEVIKSIETKRKEYEKSKDFVIEVQLQVIKICLDCLPIEDRVAISCKFIEKVTYIELAKRLRLPGKITSDKGKKKLIRL